MTQTSRPTGQHTDNYPDGDSGPYSSLQWRTVFKELFTTDDDQGPIGGYLNELAVTNPIGKTMRVASGGAIVGGNVFFNDADVDFSPPNPAGAARYDYVVACLNDTDTVMTVSDAGHTLAFPTVLTDYNSASSIQEYACRLAIVRGAEGGGLPTLDQNDDHYMIPLASYLITTGGAVSSFTDRREFSAVRGGGTTEAWVPALVGWNDSTSTHVYPTLQTTGILPITPLGIEMTNGDDVYTFGTYRLPPDYAGGVNITSVVVPLDNGNLYGYTDYYTGGCTESINQHSSPAVSSATVSGSASHFTCAWNLTPTSSLVAGDILTLVAFREGSNVLDTVAADAYCYGWYIEYRRG